MHAFCLQQPSRALAELETALTLRSAAGEQRGVAAARRMLDLLRADGRQLAPAAPAAAAPGRGPVIRKIAARVPAKLKARTGKRRRVVVASAAVLTFGVLGTAVAMSLTAPDEHRGNDPHGRLDQVGDTGNAPVPLPSADHSPGGAAGTAGAEPGSPAGTETAAEPSASGSTSHSPSASPSKRPSSSPGATGSQAPQPTQPPVPGQSQPPEQPQPQQPGPQTSQPSVPSHGSSTPTAPPGTPTATPTVPSSTSTSAAPTTTPAKV